MLSQRSHEGESDALRSLFLGNESDATSTNKCCMLAIFSLKNICYSASLHANLLNLLDEEDRIALIL